MISEIESARNAMIADGHTPTKLFLDWNAERLVIDDLPEPVNTLNGTELLELRVELVPPGQIDARGWVIE
jgi:hypothetical protein